MRSARTRGASERYKRDRTDLSRCAPELPVDRLELSLQRPDLPSTRQPRLRIRSEPPEAAEDHLLLSLPQRTVLAPAIVHSVDLTGMRSLACP